ncbi:hypothetical protein [Geoalkalibacter sp.]|uniref:hypothetical protein n=1 Tax=Geoalkalibacter sp. TaxID=3041440 RepID=UPI00272ED55C|nr:hypothetical protein [Geoalkalibacter sp.]
MKDRISFNVNAELYADQFDELAVRLPGNHVFRDVGTRPGRDFATDVAAALAGRMPEEWHEMPAHELDGRDWRCISLFGYVDGEEDQPALEMEVPAAQLGEKARAYLGAALVAAR